MLSFILAIALAQSPTATPQPELRTLIESARLSDLRWPDFSDYKSYVDAFYRKNNYVPVWTRNGAPTPQARDAIRLFEEAAAKGLRPQDYDGGRWSARTAALRDDRARERFDLALTVSLMRYTSDLHIGRVSPKEVSFDIDLTTKK